VATLNTAGKTVSDKLSGATRYDTAVSVAAVLTEVTGHAPTAVGVASGTAFPDALTGGAFAANAGIPLLTTDPATLSDPTRLRLTGWAGSLTAVTVFGGKVAVSDPVVGGIAGAVNGTVK
jgi:hypothetical protein